MDVAALIVSILALGVAFFFARRQDELQRRLAAIEESRRSEEEEQQKKAEVSAFIERRPVRNQLHAFLVIRNPGPAVARNIAFDPGELAQHGVRLLENFGMIDSLPRNSPVPLRLFIPLNTPELIRLTVTWLDDSGTRTQVFPLSTAG